MKREEQDYMMRMIMDFTHKMKSIRFCEHQIEGMTRAVIRLLSAICNKDSSEETISELTERIGMHPTAASRLMNSLEDKQLIERKFKKGDRRVILVEPTALGRKTNEEIRSKLRAYWAEVLQCIPAEDIAHMLQIWEKIIDSMENVLEKIDEREEKIL